jgi:hypothetical protein
VRGRVWGRERNSSFLQIKREPFDSAIYPREIKLGVSTKDGCKCSEKLHL